GANELPQGSDYHVFKEGIQPMWEDKQNRNGGKWVVLLSGQLKNQLNHLWLSTLLACIGASFDDDVQVNGVVVSIRKRIDKIALWTSDSSDMAAVRRIGEQFKQFLNLSNIKISYQVHYDPYVDQSISNIAI